MNRKFKAWAVFDVNGIAEPSGHDIFSSREIARTFQEIRSGINFPLHPGAKWRVFRVKIEVMK